MSARPKNAFRDVQSTVDVDALERQILDGWEDKRIFSRSLEQTKDGTLFTFYDGPPYATGKPHYGHILQSAIKDTVLRYKTMQGYYVPRRVGWDCHGLPVETIVEKELGFKTKKDIEQFGIEKFNQKCRDTVYRYIDEFQTTLMRIGRWADYDGAYSTLDRDYMESEWWAFRQLWDQGLVYKAFRSTPYCVRCATPLSNFEVTSNYKSKTDAAVYVLLKVKSQKSKVKSKQLYLLIWTTTPWTLPGNAAVAINPNLHYVSVRHKGKDIIVARERLEALTGVVVSGKPEVIREWTADELLGLSYSPLYEVSLEGIEHGENAYRVVASEHVTAKDGTGLVHIAPAFGEEDAQLGRQMQLPTIRTVDTNGVFNELAGQWSGQHIFEANDVIVEDLKNKEFLLTQESYTHSYPFCWRCDTPLIYYALDTWFINIESLKERMFTINEQINWVPPHVKEGRFKKGIESAPDWAVSRNRFWSVPMPVWQCANCGEQVCVGSVNELEQLSEQRDIQDIHRPYVDELKWGCTKCEGQMIRVPEVLDVWFDSGCMPYSQWHYPFERKEFVEQGFPADFIAESIEMTRAWFYVLHVLATALTTSNIGLGKDKPAYKNVIASGLIFAEDGQKLSKKLKNYPEIEPTLQKYGADVLRMYLLTSTSLGEPYRFSEKDIKQLKQNVYMRLWNVYSFFVRYAHVHQWQPRGESEATSSTNLLDRWVLARLKQLEGLVVRHADAYEIDTAARAFIPFVDDLSNWYVRRSRARFQPATAQDEEDTRAALATLHTVLIRLAKILAPFMPFVGEEIYQHLTGRASVHLEQLGKPEGVTDQEHKLLEEVASARGVIAFALAERAKAGIKVRQPLSVLKTRVSLTDELRVMVAEEVNVDKVVQAEEDALETELTPELVQRGLARDIIRHGQMLRRTAGYALNDRITFIVRTGDSVLQEVLKQKEAMIMEALQADAVESDGEEDAGEDIQIEGKSIHLGVRKR